MARRSNEKEVCIEDGSAGTECWTDRWKFAFHPQHPVDRIGVRAGSATRKEKHFGVGTGNMQAGFALWQQG